ncbi:hypothetical protein J7L70_08730 [Candidatus Bathyarchaeota archaeon]|nr:hypothetical protein [Candidatus Bathyarchaeota archaeon]
MGDIGSGVWLTGFPTFDVEGVKVPKLLIGINSLLGWSHTSVGRDRWIRRYYTARRIARVFERCMELGVYGVLGPVWPRLIEAIKIAEKETGERMLFVSTTIGEPRETEKQLRMLDGLYSPICCIHGAWTDSWPLENGRFVGLEKYLRLIRRSGRVPGLACHNGDRLRLVDEGDYDVSLFVTPVNKMGFYMYPTMESILEAISRTRRPVIAIKPLASGRFDEGKIREWLEWVFSQKGVSGICVGFMSEEEAEEDIAHVKHILGIK